MEPNDPQNAERTSAFKNDPPIHRVGTPLHRRRTLRRARFDLGVVNSKESFTGAWFWALTPKRISY
jgi:hypothetical protein